MHHCCPTRHTTVRPLAFLALAIVLCRIMSVHAQTASGESVEDLRFMLRAPCVDPIKRGRRLQEQVQSLWGVADLRRALVLREWRDQDEDQRVAVVDLPNRLALARRFEQAVRDVLRQGDEASRLAILNMLAEIGTTTHGVGTRHGIARGFGRDLAALAKHWDAHLGAAAVRTLGQIDPEPDVAVSAFCDLLSVENPSQRLAAADGLVTWVRTMAQLATGDRNPDGVEVTRADFVTVGRSVLPLAAYGLRRAQPEIRRRSVQAIGYMAIALHDWALTASSPETSEDVEGFQRRAEEERTQLLPLILALAEQGPALTHALVDADAEVRLRAGRVLEDLTIPRQMLQSKALRSAQAEEGAPPLVVRPSNFVPTTASKSREEQDGTLRALAAQLADADVQARRAALDILESLGPEAAPATAALVMALADPDRFVRWASARTLGRIGPVGEESVAPALAQLLTDTDLDVRLAAVSALERLGTAAKSAVSDLRRTVGSSDPGLRMAAIRALTGIGGPEAHAALPEVTAALADGDARVRQVAAQVLGKFGPAARAAAPALSLALEDGSRDVQNAAGEALLKILQSEKQ